MDDSWRNGLLVLMYHSVGAPPLFHGGRALHVTPSRLAAQLREWQVARIPLTDLGTWNRDRPTTRQVAITFDDAYRNLHRNGIPVLRTLGVRALTYVVAGLIGKTNAWDHGSGLRRERLMDHAELRDWLEEGHEIGSHGLTHRHLTSLSRDEARREIEDSKKMLEDDFGRPVRHFCYPSGGLTDTLRDLVQAAGYETATSTQPGYNGVETDPFLLRRLLARHRRPWLAAITRR